MIEERASMEEDFKRGEREMRASETGDGENFTKRATGGSRHKYLVGFTPPKGEVMYIYTGRDYLEVIEVDRFEGESRVRRGGSRLRGDFRARVFPFAKVVKDVRIGGVLKTKESNFWGEGTFDGDFEIFGGLKIVELF